MISQNESGDSSATTRSAIGAGTINVTNGAGQTQDIAKLSRDTTNTNGTVSKTPDVNNILNQQVDTMAAAQAAGQTVSLGIGAYADMKRDAALDAAKSALDKGDLAGVSAAMADYDNWKEGGDSRAGLHAMGGALIGGLGGGSTFSTIGGATGAGISSLLAPQTKAFSDSVSSGTGSPSIGNLAGNILSGLAGAAVGGTAGAAGASNVNLYNQGHDKNETEAQKEAAEIRAQFEREKAMLGQAGVKAPPGAEAQAFTVPSPAGAAVGPKVPANLQTFTNPAQSPVIPSDWISRSGRVVGSTIYYPPGTDPSAAGATYIRVMPPGSTPVPGLENGYWISMVNGQPTNPATGGTGTRGQTHIPLPPNGMPPAK